MIRIFDCHQSDKCMLSRKINIRPHKNIALILIIINITITEGAVWDDKTSLANFFDHCRPSSTTAASFSVWNSLIQFDANRSATNSTVRRNEEECRRKKLSSNDLCHRTSSRRLNSCSFAPLSLVLWLWCWAFNTLWCCSLTVFHSLYMPRKS